MNCCLANNLSETDLPRTMCLFFIEKIILACFGRWYSNMKSVLLFSNHQFYIILFYPFVIFRNGGFFFFLVNFLFLLCSNVVTQLNQVVIPENTKDVSQRLNNNRKKLITKEQNSRQKCKSGLSSTVVVNTLSMIDLCVYSYHI